MQSEIVETIYSKRKQYRFDILRRTDNTYQVLLYQYCFEQYLEEYQWLPVRSSQIHFADSIEHALLIGKEELRNLGDSA